MAYQSPPGDSFSMPMMPEMGMPGSDLHIPPENPEQSRIFMNIPISDAENDAIVAELQKFKLSARRYAREKKQTMRTCLDYIRSKLADGDLLPIPISSEGSEKDANTNRPKVFIPIARQQYKQLVAQVKRSIIPNDHDFIRIRAKKAAGVPFEDGLTEVFKDYFKQTLISEKLGRFIDNMGWAGSAAVFPSIADDYNWVWTFDPIAQQYIPMREDTPPSPDLEILRPIDFYIDPTSANPEKLKWVYTTEKKRQEIIDSNLYFNKDKLSEYTNKNVDRNRISDISDSLTSETQNTFEDIEPHVKYDLYYVPFFEVLGKEYRNMIVGIAEEKCVVRFHPNMFPKGLNPGIFCTWMDDPDNVYGTGPVEDMKDIQRLINIIWNYLIETLARIGNRFAIDATADTTNFFGVAGGLISTDGPPQQSVHAFTGDYVEIAQLLNVTGILKAEAQQVSNAQNPFQGSSAVDFKKTATEIQTLVEGALVVMRDVIEHVSAVGIQRVLNLLMYMMADLHKAPVEVRVDDPVTGESQFITADLSVINNPEIGGFTIELVSINPAQSKQAQSEQLLKLLELVGTNPDMLFVAEPLITKIGELQGLKDIGETIQEIKAKIEQQRMEAQQQAMMQAQQAAQAGMMPPDMAA